MENFERREGEELIFLLVSIAILYVHTDRYLFI